MTIKSQIKWIRHNFSSFLFLKLTYRPFLKTLPRSSAFVILISVRFYETDCTSNISKLFLGILFHFCQQDIVLARELYRRLGVIDDMVREAEKKVIFLMAGQKRNCRNPFPAFLWLKKILRPLSSRGGWGGGKGLMARPLREEQIFLYSKLD